MADITELVQALKGKSRFELLDHSMTDHQLRVMGRVPPDSAGQNINNWLIMIRDLLIAQEGAHWKVDASKQYFLKGPADARKVVYGHRLIIQAQGMLVSELLPQIVKVVAAARPTAKLQLDSFPLTGVTADRNAKAGSQKGARPTVGG